jgi:hypothetical protein
VARVYTARPNSGWVCQFTFLFSLPRH